jgi:hypothetical protein
VAVNGTGSVFTGINIANSGTALELKGVSFNYTIDANLDADSTPSNTTYSEVNAVSYENAKFTISGIVNRGAIDGSGTGMADLLILQNMVKTKGIKCIYYNDTITNTTGYPLITKFLGETDAYSGHPTEKHFHVRFSKMNITQDAGNTKYTYTIEGYLTT